MEESNKIDINSDFKRALHIMENTNRNIFITGRAGTGKSTLLRFFRDTTKKKVAVVAPTGIAAVNVQGRTIHSFFGFRPSVTLSSIRKIPPDKQNPFKGLQTIIIDEISMVRADLLDCVERFLQLNGKSYDSPFGGMQMIFFGDLYQLPPVVPREEEEIFDSYYGSPYFFSARCFRALEMEQVELTTNYRQKDDEFINLLNAVREERVTDRHMKALNDRVDSKFKPNVEECYVYLTPKNAFAEAMNEKKLKELPGKLHIFEAKIKGKINKDDYPTVPILRLKDNAQVMMVNNDLRNRWVNGTMGRIMKIEEDGILVKMANDKIHTVRPFIWEVSKLTISNDQLLSQRLGSFTQYPIMLGWAFTIHKSQGKTFDKVVLDIGQGAFSAGQVYVALSRCTTLEGLILQRPLLKKDIWTDDTVIEFISDCKHVD